MENGLLLRGARLLVAVGQALAGRTDLRATLAAGHAVLQAETGLHTDILICSASDSTLTWCIGSTLRTLPEQEALCNRINPLLRTALQNQSTLFIPHPEDEGILPPKSADVTNGASLLLVALRHGEQSVGLLLVWVDSEVTPTMDHVDLLTAVATQFAFAIACGLLYETERAALTHTSLLLEITNLLGDTRSLSQLLTIGCMAVRDRLGVDCVVMLLNAETGYLVGASSSHLSPSQLDLMRAGPGRSPLFQALRDGHTHFPRAGDEATAPPFVRESPELAEQGLLAVRIEHRGEPLGVILLGGRHLQAVSNEMLALYRGLGKQAGLAVHNARIHDRLQFQAMTDELTGVGNHRWFQEQIDAIHRKGDPFALLLIDVDNFKQINDVHGHQRGDQVLRQIASVIRLRLPARASLYRYGGEEFTVLVPAISLESVWELAEAIRLGVYDEVHAHTNLAEPVSLSVGIACFPDHALDKDHLIHMADMALMDAKTSGRNRVNIYQQGEAILTAAAVQDRGITSTVYTLLSLLRGKDIGTHRHSQRVSRAAVMIARHMGLSPAQVSTIEWGALVHDIGKLEVDRAILTSGEPLTSEQRRQMRLHPEIGYELLLHLPVMHPVLPIVRWHHERWDGTGYPEGLQGEEVPLEARVVAVADVLDTITSGRPHLPARPWAEALAEIERGVGTQFDPTVVAAVLALADGGQTALFA